MGITPPPALHIARSISTGATTSAPHGGSDAFRGFRGRGFLALLLTLVLAAGLVPTAPLQAFGSVKYTGTDGGCTWTYDDFTDVLTIEPTNGGTGKLDSNTKRGWLICADLAKSINVKDGVTAQGDMHSLFAGMVAATSIVLPLDFDQDITNAQGMFSGCKALSSFTAPSGFGDTIENAKSMFSGCAALTSIQLPDGFGDATMQVDSMFDGSPLLSIVYLGENCNGSLLAQVPDTTRNEYVGTWIRITDPAAEYVNGMAPSDLPDDYKNAGSHASAYARQHADSVAPDRPQATAAATGSDTIEVVLSVAPPPDAFLDFSIDGTNWQDSHIFQGLESFTVYDKIQVRFSSAAYNTDARSELSATTRGYTTYDPNGGSGSMDPIVGEPDAANAPAPECTFTRPQYLFNEWNTSSDGTGTSCRPGDPVPFEKGGNTLYAVWKECQSPQITTSSLPDAAVGSPYRQKLSATGYPETFTWTLKPGSTLPEGLSLSADGIISGTPRAAGTATFTVHAANGFAPDAAKEFSLKVNDRKATVALASTGDDVAGPTGGLVALLFSAASVIALSPRPRARRR